ncbi:MAG: ABC transporter ATP-binding protein, partial [Actinomycetota bacterium]|nr:ABC transporter ATP-binding protein [Actinomycetota bacterium]
MGTADEDRVILTKADSKTVRQRSVRLLGSLIRPVRARFIATVALVVLSQATRVAGPLLIAFGIDHALPALIGAHGAGRNPWPLIFAGGSYLLAA